jgi:hypothetical protein
VASAAGQVGAGIVIYTDRNAFLAALSGGHFQEDFTGLPGPRRTLFASPRSISGNGFGFTASATSGFATQVIGGDKSLSTLFSPDPIKLGWLTGPVTAIGGFFFTANSAGNGVDTTGALSLLATAGSSTATQPIAAPTSVTSFVGFISDAGPFSSLVINRTTGNGTGFVSADGVILGTAAAPTLAPEPSTFVLAAVGGTALAGGLWLRRRRAAKA